MKKAMDRIWCALIRVLSGPIVRDEREDEAAGCGASRKSHIFVGEFTTGDARRLLERFNAEGVGFEIECNVCASAGSDEGFWDRPRISIFVNSADANRATELIRGLS